jgi:uncharacterized small protein (DUF1192 family)
MELDDRPRPKGDAASQLAGELLDSQNELAHRIAMLEAEIVRVAAHRDKKAAHMRAAASLFGGSPSGGQPSGESTQ